MKKVFVFFILSLFVLSFAQGIVSLQKVYQLKEGDTVEATGVVLISPNALMNKTTWIQDATAGIMLYGNLPELKIGDVVKVTGKTKLYYGILEILPDKIEVIGKEQVQPVNLNKIFEEEAKKGQITKQKIGELFNNNMSRLVSVSGVISDIQAYQFIVKTDYFDILIYIRKEANISTKELKKGDKVTVNGIMYLYKDTFEILPRFQADIVKN
uniref:Nucleotide-binding protein n=1 Tax=Fervidobacterium nodosum TaxID=2424 RepID=A0A7C5U6E2_9BACT